MEWVGGIVQLSLERKLYYLYAYNIEYLWNSYITEEISEQCSVTKVSKEEGGKFWRVQNWGVLIQTALMFAPCLNIGALCTSNGRRHSSQRSLWDPANMHTHDVAGTDIAMCYILRKGYSLHFLSLWLLLLSNLGRYIRHYFCTRMILIITLHCHCQSLNSYMIRIIKK